MKIEGSIDFNNLFVQMENFHRSWFFSFGLKRINQDSCSLWKKMIWSIQFYNFFAVIFRSIVKRKRKAQNITKKKLTLSQYIPLIGSDLNPFIFWVQWTFCFFNIFVSKKEFSVFSFTFFFCFTIVCISCRFLLKTT